MSYDKMIESLENIEIDFQYDEHYLTESLKMSDTYKNHNIIDVLAKLEKVNITLHMIDELKSMIKTFA